MKRQFLLMVLAVLLLFLPKPGGFLAAKIEKGYLEQDTQRLKINLRIQVETDRTTWMVYFAPEENKTKSKGQQNILLLDTETERVCQPSSTNGTFCRGADVVRVITRITVRLIKHWIKEQFQLWKTV